MPKQFKTKRFDLVKTDRVQILVRTDNLATKQDWWLEVMESPIYIRKFGRVFKLALILIILTSINIWGQTSNNPFKPYIEETVRLKQQKAVLSSEIEAYKQTLLAEKQESAKLQVNLKEMQLEIRARDQQSTDLKVKLSVANQSIIRQKFLVALFGWIMAVVLFGLLFYSQRVALRQQLRRLMQWRVKALAKNSSQQLKKTNRIDQSIIRPEEIFERIYGRRTAKKVG